jgi:hypothetical protein
MLSLDMLSFFMPVSFAGRFELGVMGSIPSGGLVEVCALPRTAKKIRLCWTLGYAWMTMMYPNMLAQSRQERYDFFYPKPGAAGA